MLHYLLYNICNINRQNKFSLNQFLITIIA